MIFHADSESDLKTSPNQVKNPILLKSDFYKNWAAASAEGLLNKTMTYRRAAPLELDRNVGRSPP